MAITQERAVYANRLADDPGPAFLLTVDLPAMLEQDERALAGDVFAIAISTHDPGQWAQHVLGVGSVAYVPDERGISIINGRTLMADIDAIPVQSGVNDLAFALRPAFFRAYTVPNTPQMLDPIDLVTRMSMTGIPVANAVSAGVTSDATCVFTAGSIISVIDTTMNTVVETIDVGRPTTGIAVKDFSWTGGPGSNSWAVADRSGTVFKFETGSMTADARVDLGSQNGPMAIALDADGGTAFVANFNTATVSVIRTSSMTVVGAPIPVGRFPIAVAAR